MIKYIAFFIIALMFGPVLFADTIIQRELESPELVGSGEFRTMFWKIYEAELHAKDGEFSEDTPFALKLTYSRKLKGNLITDKSIELIRKQGIEDETLLADWHEQLNDIFPDVQNGTEIVGVHTVGVGTKFYVDGEDSGLITDPRLCRSFFDIWLGEDTTAPKLRSKLLGLKSN